MQGKQDILALALTFFALAIVLAIATCAGQCVNEWERAERTEFP